MQINEETAQQFLDAINDYVSNGDIEIDAITPYEAGNMHRHEMDAFLFELFEACLMLQEAK
jgi:hypothetical protein